MFLDKVIITFPLIKTALRSKFSYPVESKFRLHDNIEDEVNSDNSATDKVEEIYKSF